MWAERREVNEWIQSVAAVLEQGWNDQYAVWNKELWQQLMFCDLEQQLAGLQDNTSFLQAIILASA